MKPNMQEVVIIPPQSGTCRATLAMPRTWGVPPSKAEGSQSLSNRAVLFRSKVVALWLQLFIALAETKSEWVKTYSEPDKLPQIAVTWRLPGGGESGQTLASATVMIRNQGAQ